MKTTCSYKIACHLARLLYTVIFYLLLPFIVLRLLWRSVKAPAYRSRLLERFGVFPCKHSLLTKTVWLHTVSVGETIAAKPFVNNFLIAHPDHQLLITTMTPTGSAQVKHLFADELNKGRVLHSYIPYDVPDCLQRFLKTTQPDVAIFMETEVWPNTIAACKKRNIPILLINARMSKKSFAGYHRFALLSYPTFNAIDTVLAQSQDDADRIKRLGAATIHISGSIKSEITVDKSLSAAAKQLKREWSSHESKKIIIATSTHEGEEALILSIYQSLLKQYDILLVLVPRHPERFEKVKALCKSEGFSVISRSDNKRPTSQTQVIVGDTMGEMMLMCGASDIAIVCGSFIPHGGHNMLEPAAWGLPIISGDSVFNFQKITDDLQKEKAMLLVSNQAELSKSLCSLLDDEKLRVSLGGSAKAYVKRCQGALMKIMDAVDKHLK